MGNDNKLGLDPEDARNKEGFTIYNQFVMPVGRPVRLHLRSRDVIHSFYVPEFRVYQDMVPGRTITWLWIQATKAGNYAIACNQLCGAGHYNMQAKIKVIPAEEYDTWYKGKLPKTATANAGNANPPTTLISASLPATQNTP
jgi:cytochrome c oxidase subunit II